ncbi:hypothetical protein BN7_5158 [Wickerhamomyces ciferrii]|uniref:Uncharacterized protein n=1 Tax=Wickerhamomyces ciferrii (strain ATCC 14091 / BCRC 22168 / CBS 111 / JCM 3599 / NBRC 0793 / NRRL Y-1031 F-60-10) TaxID=1206466 RepID=K0KR18_WICCF|nr:uncharacterized protein BN7_5158 [Wickerhamomyces ciferrii]CCH45576.1 hypothetical protein BN7_5158 [Wickerhamomyces ciferrii]
MMLSSRLIKRYVPIQAIPTFQYRTKSTSTNHLVSLDKVNPKREDKVLDYKKIKSIASSSSTSLGYSKYLKESGKLQRHQSKLSVTNTSHDKNHIKEFHEALQRDFFKLYKIIETTKYDKDDPQSLTIALMKLWLGFPSTIKTYSNHPSEKVHKETNKENEDDTISIPLHDKTKRKFVGKYLDMGFFEKECDNSSSLDPMVIFENLYTYEKLHLNSPINIMSKYDIQSQILKLIIHPIVNLTNNIVYGKPYFSYRFQVLSNNSVNKRCVYPNILIITDQKNSTEIIFKIESVLPKSITDGNLDLIPGFSQLNQHMTHSKCNNEYKYKLSPEDNTNPDNYDVKNSRSEDDDDVDHELKDHLEFRKKLLDNTELPNLQDIFDEVYIPKESKKLKRFYKVNIPDKKLQKLDVGNGREVQTITVKSAVFKLYFSHCFHIDVDDSKLSSILKKCKSIQIRAYDPIRYLTEDDLKEYIYLDYPIEHDLLDNIFESDYKKLKILIIVIH